MHFSATMLQFFGKLLALLEPSVSRGQKRYTSSLYPDSIHESELRPLNMFDDELRESKGEADILLKTADLQPLHFLSH